MTGNIVSEAVGILIDIAIVSLVIERVASMQRRREWDFAYSTLIESVAATFVDIMRLLYVRTSPRAFSVNIDRYEEFIKIATLHASTLRSNIEGFATALTPEAHGLCRRTEQRLLWMIDRLAEPPRAPVTEERYFTLVNGVAAELITFSQKEGGRRYQNEQQAIDAALHSVGEFRGDGGESGTLNDLWRYRLNVQSEFLRSTQADSGVSVRGIRGDFDNRYSLGYFLLDSKLLPLACAILRSP
ncbi:hypothetical protein GCM10022232_87790 [Streptomyces plumbiresistens]|uniref:Uncharacterized protein n=2 Tax=Streptomyces plumbiresistens TaxID=511811 RepID=A0ABP7TM57_9ACTN